MDNVLFQQGSINVSRWWFPRACMWGDLISGVDEIVNLSTQHLLYGNLKLQATTQNRHGGDYCIPTLDAWATMVQPIIGVHQSQCSSVF